MTLKPLARNARYPGFACFSASIRLTVRITWSASPESRLPRLAPPSISNPSPVARRRSISAQSAGAEHVITVPVSFSTHRNAGMSSFEPSRMPAWLAPVCDDRSVSHSIKWWEPSASQRAMFGAFPSRIARWSTGSASPSISRKTTPGALVCVRSPERRAIRWTTRNVYVSSSFVPNSVSRATPSAEATSATPSAAQNESIDRSPFVMLSAARSISASRLSTSRKPIASMNGSRSAAISGGTAAFSTAMTATASRAPKKSFTDAPGTINAAISSAAAETSHAKSSASGLIRGRPGVQSGVSPYVLSSGCVISGGRFARQQASHLGLAHPEGARARTPRGLRSPASRSPCERDHAPG